MYRFIPVELKQFPKFYRYGRQAPGKTISIKDEYLEISQTYLVNLKLNLNFYNKYKKNSIEAELNIYKICLVAG